MADSGNALDDGTIDLAPRVDATSGRGAGAILRAINYITQLPDFPITKFGFLALDF